MLDAEAYLELPFLWEQITIKNLFKTKFSPRGELNPVCGQSPYRAYN